jgi:outer membrane protein assembly factor BamB
MHMNISRVLSVSAFVVVCASAATSAIRVQQAPANWLTDGADSRRTAWQQNETILTTANVKDMKLLWKIKLDNQTRQMHSLFPPLIVGSATTTAGPRQIAVVAGVSDNLYGIDVEKGTLLWKRHFDSTYQEPPPVPGGRGGSVLCPGGLTATPVIAPTAAPGKYIVYAVSWDGRLRTVDVATGEEIEPPAPFLPPNGKPYGLNLVNGVIYTTTAQGCGGNPNQFYSYDLATKKVGYYNPGSGGLWPRSGPSVGKDGTVYAGSGDGDYYTLAKADFVAAPIVVQHKEKDLVAVAAKDGRIFVLDGASLQVPLATTPAAGELTGEGLASWQDEKGIRWIAAAATGTVVAYRLADEGPGLALQKGWTSRALVAPLTLLVVNGVVFALSSGEEESSGAAARAARSSPAVLYALDSASGKELWSSGKSITAPARGGLSAGAGVVYVPTTDSTLYAFGFPIEK